MQRKLMLFGIVLMLVMLVMPLAAQSDTDSRLLKAQELKSQGDFHQAAREYELSANQSYSKCALGKVLETYSEYSEMLESQSKTKDLPELWSGVGDRLFDAPCMGSIAFAAEAYSVSGTYREAADAREFYSKVAGKYSGRMRGVTMPYGLAELSKYAAKFSLKAGEHTKAQEYINQSLQYYRDTYGEEYPAEQVMHLEINTCQDKNCQRKTRKFPGGDMVYITASLYAVGEKLDSEITGYVITPGEEIIKLDFSRQAAASFKPESYGRYTLSAKAVREGLPSTESSIPLHVRNPGCDEDNICDPNEDHTTCPQDCPGKAGKTDNNYPIHYIILATVIMTLVLFLAYRKIQEKKKWEELERKYTKT